jgi:Uma2 family endonuclease
MRYAPAMGDVTAPSGILPFRAPAELLPLRIRPARRIDDDELYALCRENPDLRIERDAEGDLIVMPPTGGETGNRNFRLLVELGAWCKRDGTGVGFHSSTGFILPNGAERSPDAAWIRRDRWDALSAEQRRRFAPIVPDFVAELRSPSDDSDDVHAKMREWVAQGVRLGWVLDPGDRSVTVYTPDARPQRLVDPPSVAGDPVLPGLVLTLADVW